MLVSSYTGLEHNFFFGIFRKQMAFHSSLQCLGQVFEFNKLRGTGGGGGYRDIEGSGFIYTEGSYSSILYTYMRRN